MSLFQILDCSNELGTCCNDSGIVLLLDSTRKLMNLIQIIVPIMLIVWSMYQLFLLMQNPDQKDGIKKIINKFIAAAFVFFIPMTINIVFSLTSTNFSVSSCWEKAKGAAEIARSKSGSYLEINKKKSVSILNDPSLYEDGNPREISDGGSSGGASTTGSGTGTSTNGSGTGTSTNGSATGISTNGSATGISIVQYAKSFVGQRYVWGGSWNGELPYTGTDCSGFVQGVFKHHGINLSRTTYTQWADRGSYTLVSEGNIKPGDLIMYDGHVGILTGNGNEIVHAKGSNWGIVVDPDYHRCSSHAILGIMRINGVN